MNSRNVNSKNRETQENYFIFTLIILVYWVKNVNRPMCILKGENEINSCDRTEADNDMLR